MTGINFICNDEFFDIDGGPSGSLLQTKVYRGYGDVRDKVFEIDAFITSSGPISTL